LLWVAGHAVEDRLGRQRFVAFFLGSSILGGLAMAGATYLHVRGASPEHTYIVSCAVPVTALLALLTLQSPRSTLTFFHSLTVPVWVLLAVAIGTDVIWLVWPHANVPATDGRPVTLAGHFGALMAAMMFHALL